jgi:hypothetical protein
MKKPLGVAYAMKKNNAKKQQAKSEPRPSPETKVDDSQEVEQNDSKKSLPDDKWTSNGPTNAARKGPRTEPIKHPKMVPSKGFTAKLRSEEDHLMKTAPPEKTEGISEDKPKKMAEGGPISATFEHERPDEQLEAGAADDGMDDAVMAAEGGMMGEDEQSEMEHASIAAAIMAKHARKMMAEGGAVDIEQNQEDGEDHPDRPYESILKEHYGDDLDELDQPMDSNEHGHEISDEDAHDVVSKIMKKMRKSPIDR